MPWTMWRFVAVAAVSSTALPALAQIAVQNQGYIPYSDAPINYRTRPGDRSGRQAATADRSWRSKAGLRAEARLPAVGAREARNPDQFADPGLFQDQLPVQEDLSANAARAVLQRRRVRRARCTTARCSSWCPSIRCRARSSTFWTNTDRPSGLRARRAGLHAVPRRGRHARGSRRPAAVDLHHAQRRTQARRTHRSSPDSKAHLKDRWGGWYVTGTHGSQTHMGNVLVQDEDNPEQLDRAAGANVTRSLRSGSTPAAYLTGSSDIVAHLVLAPPDADAQPDHADQLPDPAGALRERGQATDPTVHADDQRKQYRKARRRAGALSAFRQRSAARGCR